MPPSFALKIYFLFIELDSVCHFTELQAKVEQFLVCTPYAYSSLIELNGAYFGVLSDAQGAQRKTPKSGSLGGCRTLKDLDRVLIRRKFWGVGSAVLRLVLLEAKICHPVFAGLNHTKGYQNRWFPKMAGSGNVQTEQF